MPENNFNPYGNTPFVRFFIPLALGILLFNFFPSPVSLFGYITLTLFIVLLLFHFIIKAYFKPFLMWVWGILLTVSLCIFGYVLSSMQYPLYHHTFSDFPKSLIVAQVQTTPEIKTSVVKLSVSMKAVKANNKWISTRENCLLYIPKDSHAVNIQVGDDMVFFSKPQEPKNNGNPDEFDYKQFLAYHHFSYTAYAKAYQWSKLQTPKSVNIRFIAERAQHKFVQMLHNLGLTDDVLSISSAIVLGYRNDMDTEIKQAYSTAGATFLLVVSGLHVGVVYLVIDYLLFFLKRKKWQFWLKLFLTLTLLWSYAFITGLSASVLRAAIMFSFVAISKQINRKTNIYNTLAASAMFLLLFNPFLLFDIGFQLSYICVAGIVYFQPKFKTLLYIKNRILYSVWELICVTLAAQIVSTPFSLYYFHQFPTYFMIAGIALVPLTSFVIYFTLFSLFFSWLPYVSTVFVYALKGVVIFMNTTVTFVENLPGSLIQNIYINKIQLIILYLLIFAFALFFVHKKIKYLRWILALIIIYSSSMIFNKVKTLNQLEIFVYNINGTSTLDLIDGNKNILFVSDLKTDKIMFSVKGNWLSSGLSNNKIIPFSDTNSKAVMPDVFIKNNFLIFHGYKIMFINNNRFKYKKSNTFMNIDLLILQNKADIKLTELLKIVHPRQIVIDSSCPPYKTNKWLAEANAEHINTHICKLQGAWNIKISENNLKM
jgi:competence protein ComEC